MQEPNTAEGGSAAVSSGSFREMTPDEKMENLIASEHIGQFFKYGHLPPHLQTVSAEFGRMAADIAAGLPRNAERTVALRKLLEAKDAAVRAVLAQ